MFIFCEALYIPSHRQFYILWITVITIAYEAMSFLYLVNHCQIFQNHSFKVLYLMKHCDLYTLWHTEMFIHYESLRCLYIMNHCLFYMLWCIVYLGLKMQKKLYMLCITVYILWIMVYILWITVFYITTETRFFL